MSRRRSIPVPVPVPFAFFVLLTAAACQNPAKDKPKAEVAAPVEVAPATAAASAVTYRFGPPDSKIEFVGAKVTKKHDGSFSNFSGSIQVPDGRAEKGTVTAEVDVASLNSDDPKLTGHLKSADFFDAQKFPKITFTSTGIKPGAEQGKTHTVTGNLTMKDVTKSITFPATVRVASDTVRVEAEFAINRKDWGITYPGMPDDLIRDEVVVRLSLQGKRS